MNLEVKKLIKSIGINNFQSHEQTNIDFCDGVNVIVGSSNNGKTSILRAINVVVKNKPNGISYIRNGADTCSVKLTVDDVEITRLRDRAGKNEYYIGGELMKAFGQNVPDAVSECTKFSSLNIQNQMDAPFFLGLSAGEAARYLDSVVGLDEIDTVQKNIEKMKRDFRQRLTAQEKLSGELGELIDNLEWVEKCGVELEKITIIVEENERKKNSLSDMIYLLEEIEKTTKEIFALDSYLASKDLLDRTLDLYERNCNIYAELEILQTIEADIQTVSAELEELGRYENSDVDVIDFLLGCLSGVEQTYGVIDDLKILKKQIVVSEKNILMLSQAVKEKAREYSDFLAKLDFCPFCNSNLSEDSIPF